MKVIDPVCKMTIEAKEAAATSTYKGETYYFCSKPCKQDFDKVPESFLGEKATFKTPQSTAEHTCPMHPEVRQIGPGSCPKCGMALEPVEVSAPVTKTEWTCPMHPEIVCDAPGACPICGMALEPRTVTLEQEENPELVDMRRRFWVSTLLTVPVFVIAMRHLLPGDPLSRLLSHQLLSWLEFLLATPVVVWGGWPFFVRGGRSVVTWNLNMYTLIALCVVVAYAYSVVAHLFPGLFPPSFRSPTGEVGVYFEAAAVITTLVLLGEVLQLQARSRTGAAIKALLGLAPKTARRLADDGSEADVPLDQVHP